MMITEIIGGALFGSMALMADGWHMATHAAALGIAALAYRFARTHVHDPRFAFGTGKLGELAAFSSAIILAMIALFIAYESFTRLLAPRPIYFAEALPIACVGLLVNLASAWLLHDEAEIHTTTTIMDIIITPTTTRIFVRPTSMSWPMPSLPFWLSLRFLRAE